MAVNNEDEQSISMHVENEFTLDDTYDHLKDIQKEMREHVEQLIMKMGSVNKNTSQTLSSHVAVTPDYIQQKQRQFIQTLLKYDDNYNLKIHPMCNTIDVYKSVVWELEQEVMNIEKMFDKFKVDILNIKNNIACLENEKNNLERMKETCVDAIGRNITDGVIDDEEILNTKKLFVAVKSDLASTVNMIFPEHAEFKEILGELTSAYMKESGDQVYVDVDTKYTDCIKFMVEADIATYHRNDKNKLRLVDLL